MPLVAFRHFGNVEIKLVEVQIKPTYKELVMLNKRTNGEEVTELRRWPFFLCTENT